MSPARPSWNTPPQQNPVTCMSALRDMCSEHIKAALSQGSRPSSTGSHLITYPELVDLIDRPSVASRLTGHAESTGASCLSVTAPCARLLWRLSTPSASGTYRTVGQPGKAVALDRAQHAVAGAAIRGRGSVSVAISGRPPRSPRGGVGRLRTGLCPRRSSSGTGRRALSGCSRPSS
jgi:hypothetical protein